MSLLMDALKKAERAKQQAQADSVSALETADLSSEPAMPTEPAPNADSAEIPPFLQTSTTLPDLRKLEDLDAEFIAHARKAGAQRLPAAAERATPQSGGGTHARPVVPPAPLSLAPGAPPADSAAEKNAIRNAFAVKKAPGNDKTLVLITAMIGALAVGGIGIYFWLQLKPTPGLVAQKPGAGSGPGVPVSPVGEVRSGYKVPPPVATAMASDPVQPRRVGTPTRRSPGELRRPARVQQAYPAGDTQIRVTAAQAMIDPVSAEGYAALQSGNLVAARAAYERLLRADPRNAEALHGIAAVALREGRTTEAETAYLRILEANPGDAAAQAGLVGLNTQGDPVVGESRMKALLAAQGDVPVVNFALGNLYARQSRWSEAQQAYFKAVSGDGGNSDYLFNLAVSLDQLHQPKLAAQYYGQALAAAENRPAAFDRSRAAMRLRELQR